MCRAYAIISVCFFSLFFHMASPFVAAAAQVCKRNQSSSKNNSSASPRTIRRTWSSNDSSDAAATAAATKSCVCAPSTHAGSFKCRLHRVNSHGPSSPPPAPQPAVSSSSTRTVEAQ